MLNLCELDNPWVMHAGRHLNDRFACKGEMAIGMDMSDLLAEGRWVAERLRAGQRVLVHCYAGVNRSSTVCCAALMLMEGIPAEEALAECAKIIPTVGPIPTTGSCWNTCLTRSPPKNWRAKIPTSFPR